jgi:hypothetical protein
MLETPKALDTIIIIIISENSNGYNNGQSAGNQKILNNILVGSPETTRKSHYKVIYSPVE